MKMVDIAIIGSGVGLTMVGLALRKQGKSSWLGLFAGGITVFVLGILSIVFGLSL
jgi:hypothetical protein